MIDFVTEIAAWRRKVEERDEQIERLRGALKVIDSVVPSAVPGNSDGYVKAICRKYLGVNG